MTPVSVQNSDDEYVGFDVDDVLFRLRPFLLDGVARRFGKPANWSDWSSYNFYDGLMSKQDFMQMIIDDRMLEECQPDEGAIEAVQRLKSEGLKIALITARGFHPMAQEVTLESFRRHGMPVDHLHVVESGKGKAEPALAIANMVAYVHDYAEHLDDIAKAFQAAGRDLHLSLMSRPWNTHNECHHRITSLDQFVDVVLQTRLDAKKVSTTHLGRPKR